MVAKNSSQPRSIGGFELLAKIGQGGMGSVYRARQESLDRVVALKVLPPDTSQKKATFIERFYREARVSAKLNHPHIVQGIDVGQDEATGLYYFAMEYIDGLNVGQLVKREGALAEGRALEIVKQMAAALTCAHAAGIVHRDIKPDNILLTSNGEAKLADLGLAKDIGFGAQDEAEAASPNKSPITADAGLTQTGMVLGTPHYMAPEQVRGLVHQLDIRTDLYALGATLFYMLTGQPPFSGPNSAKIMEQHLSAPPPDARTIKPALSEGICALIQRLMKKEPAQRFQTPQELQAAIELVQHPPASTGRGSRTHAPTLKTKSIRAAYKTMSSSGLKWSDMALGGGIVAVIVVFIIMANSGRSSDTAKLKVAHTDEKKTALLQDPAVPPIVPPPQGFSILLTFHS